MNSNEIRTTPVADIELPVELDRLYDLAYNLWWSWSYRAVALFSTIDPEHWNRYRNPVQVLINVEPQRWESLLRNEAFLAAYHGLVAELDEYLEGRESAWFPTRFPDFDGGPVVYVSPEFGWHESLGIYSGGLGVLAGDHCKSASDEGVPFVGVGLLYDRGYFRQTIDADGHQQHFYPNYDTSRLPLLPVVDRNGRAVRVSVPFPAREIQLRVWKATVGRVPVLLLDSNVEANALADRPITSLLYVRGREMRFCQETILGVGAVRVMAALGITPSVWHMNEGHSALLGVERIRELAASDDLSLDEARERLAAHTVFTTHTPVPAGNEVFDRGLAARYVGAVLGDRTELLEPVLDMGRSHDDADGASFNLTALALRVSSRVNGVSELHGAVVRRIWEPLLADRPGGAAAAIGITNGVHTPSWLGPELGDLLARHLGPRFMDNLLDPGFADAVRSIPDAEVWSAHTAQKARLIRFARHRLLDQLARHGRGPDELREAEQILDPEALTVGFARRFATYKRAALLFRDRERLRQALGQEGRPAQVLFAGKAHPADRPGQAVLQEIFQASRSDDLRGKILVLEDYDMHVGRMLVQGVELWLNTPVRPLEASGTSGQKAAANGGLNFSVADGWWAEAFDASHGWLIGEDREYEEGEDQDTLHAAAIYDSLVQDILPAFFERDEDGVPRAWVGRMKEALATLTPRFSTCRMVRDYTEASYVPASRGETPRVVAAGTTED